MVNIEDYEKIIGEMEKYNRQVSLLEKELDKIEDDEKRNIEILAGISAQIENQLEEINNAKKRDDNTINEAALHKKCKQTIGYFLHDIINEFHPSFSLQIRIDYHRMKIFRNIIDDKMTFGMLKEDTKNQFGKDIKDFFYADEKGHIFLDEIMVIPALFPLARVKVDKYEAVVYVLDKILHKPFIEKEKEDKPKEYYEEEIDDFHDTIFSKIMQVVKSNTLKMIYTFFLVCLIALYSINVKDYRQADQYRSLQFSLNPYTHKFTDIEIEPFNFMKTLTMQLKYFVRFSDNLVHNQGIYDSLLKTNYIRLIQKRAKSNLNCSNKRIEYKNADECLNLFEFGHEPIKTGNRIFNYEYQTKHKRISGKYYDYDTSGYVLDIPIESQKIMNKAIEPLENWITLETASVILIMNFYSINTNSIIILRFLFERDLYSTVFKSVYDIQFVYLDQKLDWYLIACILITFVMITLQCFLLKENKKKDSTIDNNILADGEITCAKRCQRFNLYIKNNFRFPHTLEIICLVNIIFFYAMLIVRYNLLTHYKNNPLSSSDSYEDYQSIAQNYEYITAANCFNLIVLFVDLMAILASYFDELQTITSGLSNYLKKVYYYFMLFVLPFMMISFYVSYILFGDDFMTFYRSIPFIILKVFQTFDHGSMDHDDYANGDIIAKRKTKSYAFIDMTQNSYRSIMDNAGYPGYIIFSILYFLVCIILIKGFVIGNFYLSYRDQHIQRLINEAKKRKEEMGMQRTLLRNEEKKRLEMEVKEQKETISEQEKGVEYIDTYSINTRKNLK